MKVKFKNIPNDKDTVSGYRKETKLGPYDAVHEHWGLEGIAAEAFILANDDIAGLKDEELEDLVRNSEQWDHDSKIIVKRPEGKAFTFINASVSTVNASVRARRFGSVISAMPTQREKRTIAGSRPLTRASKGFAGM